MKRVDWPVARKSRAQRGPGLVSVILTVQRVDAVGDLTHSAIADRDHQVGRSALQHVEGEDHVVGGERLAVAPLHAVAQLDGDLGEVGVVGEAFGLPRDQLVGDVVGVEQHLVDGVVEAVALVQQHAVIRAEVVGRRHLVVEIPALGDQRAVARYVRSDCAATSPVPATEPSPAPSRLEVQQFVSLLVSSRMQGYPSRENFLA